MPGSLFPHQFMLQNRVAVSTCPNLLWFDLAARWVCRASAFVPGCCSPSTLLLFVFPGQQPEKPLSCGCESADRKNHLIRQRLRENVGRLRWGRHAACFFPPDRAPAVGV